MHEQFVHLDSTLDPSTLEALADFICGDNATRFPMYRTSSMLTRFFESVQLRRAHDGTTRKRWVCDVLRSLDSGDLERVILRLVDPREYGGQKPSLALAVASMNDILAIDGFGIEFQGTRPGLVRAESISFTTADLLTSRPVATDEAAFLRKQFSEIINIQDLKLDPVITPFLQNRIDEVQACPRDKVPLGTIFLLGSTLEGILLAVAILNPATFSSANAAPKDKTGKVYPLHDWKLASLIDVAYEIQLLNLDIKKFSHVLRDFRNYIHPFHQMSNNFSPDQDTVDICWQVFKAAFAQLKAAVR